MLKTIQDIFEKTKTHFQFETGAKLSGIAQALAAAFSSRLAEFYSKLRFLEKQSFVATADTDYLFLHAGEMVPYRLATKATGSVVFFGEVGTRTPKGL